MCESQSHYFILRERNNPKNIMFCPFRCNSWRHAGRCQHFKGAQDFVRVSQGIASRGDQWVWIVLTFDQRRENSERDCYIEGLPRWKKLEKRLFRRFGRSDYLQTWEAHESGFPHVNIAIHNPKIWQACAGDGWIDFARWLRPHAAQCGFGRIIPYVEPLRPDTGAGLAGYLTKLSRELTGAGVKNQVPVNAPAHFRRIRASRGLLPPIFRPGRYEAAMVPSSALGKVDLAATLDQVIALRLSEAEKKNKGV